MYCYWDFNLEKNGDGPTFEEYDRASSFLHPISDPEKRCPFGIVEIDEDDFQAIKQYPYVKEVPEMVRLLLSSATRYPPALALAKETIYDMNLNESIQMEVFNGIVIDVLRRFLERQWRDPFVLAEVLIPKESETIVGEFRWIIGYTPKIKVVHYVDYSYFSSTDHISSFRLTAEQIKQLPIIEMTCYVLIDNENRRYAEFDLMDETLDFNKISELIRTIR